MVTAGYGSPMSDHYTDPKTADVAKFLLQLQSLLGGAVETAADRDTELGGDLQLQKRLRGTIAGLQLVGLFNVLEGAFGQRCWEGTGCHEEEFKLLWALRSAVVHGNGHVRKLRGNHQRKTITEGLKQLNDGVFSVTPYFQLVDGVVHFDGANLRLGTLLKDLLKQKDEASPQ
ncbi:MAG: hypothetical protein JKY65_30520 [Planctomycetes bacterium]|nr:hypothetical protein [Planctomycetota bacterium]